MAEITKEELLARYAAGERDFSGLDFSGIIFGRCVLNSCNFRGANFSGANFSNWTHIMYCDFRDTIFRGANLSYCSFSGSNFSGADMREVDFTNGEGIGVIFENTNLRGIKGSFVTEGTLYIRNCIGEKGEIINRFGKYIVIKELENRYVDEWNGIPMDQIRPVGLNNTKLSNVNIDDDIISF
ncbi:pentapeptide repeat-containing protein [Crocosphaera chwakensis]|uniref:Pentapeptide repeat family protein n=1 Tax=Crocosphaera chwakensis CCY0110 TaxID=391612 RepID=A3ILL0_9CHRO|nr:pentapeptide repeat-containing protein [Crocosphaera chwakensis]EAZ92661.1 pentapeptide repeat family protein [Crocosphaera chwakensis CCY0110]